MKGVVEFRKVEKDAMRAQEDCRVQAKETDRIENTRQAGLFSALQLAIEASYRSCHGRPLVPLSAAARTTPSATTSGSGWLSAHAVAHNS